MTSAEIEAQARRADHLCELGRWAEAERVLRTVLASVPDDRDALSSLTEVLEHLARPHDAAEVAQLLARARV